MNPQQLEIYQRIQSFPLDEADSNFPFSQKLARENDWSAEYTQRVIEEYKKFTFLAVVAGHPVSPSDSVDQVWHLHLTYTHSYWEEFCPNILQMPFHHLPSRGGKSEQDKLNDWYSNTLESYQSFFGKAPPDDIWTPLDIRCNRPETFRRVNTQENWILSKPFIRLPKPNIVPWLRPIPASQIVALLLLLALTVTGCQSSFTTIPNPLDFTGPEFIGFYMSVVSIAIFFAYILRGYLENTGALATSSKRQIVKVLPGLSVSMVLLLGIAKIVVGISREKPVGILFILCIITGIFVFDLLVNSPQSSSFKPSQSSSFKPSQSSSSPSYKSSSSSKGSSGGSDSGGSSCGGSSCGGGDSGGGGGCGGCSGGGGD